MIHVIDDYYINVEELNYTAMLDLHKKTKPDKITGESKDTYKTIGYYSTPDNAIIGMVKYRMKEKLKGAKVTHTLEQAIKIIQESNKEVTELLEKCLKEER